MEYKFLVNHMFWAKIGSWGGVQSGGREGRTATRAEDTRIVIFGDEHANKIAIKLCAKRAKTHPKFNAII